MDEPANFDSDTLALWSDDPSATDLLAFDAVATTVADALLDDRLDPLALGLSGPWGSGKTTVLRLIEQDLRRRELAGAKVLVVETDPWRYDPSTGAKESLIAEVLTRLGAEIDTAEGKADRAKKVLKRLVGRVNWSKAIRLAAKTGLALQIPSVDDLMDLVKDGGDDDDAPVRGMDGFRSEFAELMASDELQHLKRVVVLVDDLDRCLPETVIDTLEAIRLFLAVPKMSFVLAADEERVAQAIRTRFPKAEAVGDPPERGATEDPANLYLHKIVQTTIRLPALSRFDTQAFLLLLQLQSRLEPLQLQTFVDQCQVLRLAAGDLDDVTGIAGIDIADELAFAARLTPLLYEKLRGSPRRVKRFLNDMHVRQAVARRRGIQLEAPVVAKLMVLEVLLPDEFEQVLDWLARGTMREQLDALELAAGRPPVEPTDPESTDPEGAAAPTPAVDNQPEFSDSLLRWAKLPPELSTIDLAGYLYLAAAFKGDPLLDSGLPDRLQDIAANLLSTSRAEQKSVTDQDLAVLSAPDAQVLVQHLGRMARDRPTDQRKAVTGLLRVVVGHPEALSDGTKALLAIPVDEIAPATPMLFKYPDHAGFLTVLERWRDHAKRDPVRAAATEALKGFKS